MTKNLIRPVGMIPYALRAMNKYWGDNFFPVKLPYMTCLGLFSLKEIYNYTIYPPGSRYDPLLTSN